MRSLLRWLAVSLLLAALCGGAAGAAIVVDNTASTAGNDTSLTWSHTIGTGLNRLLVVGVAMRKGNVVPTGVTFGGVPLTNIGTLATGKKDAGVSLWGLASPASGAAGIVVTFGSKQKATAGSVSFDGVDQTTPWGAFVSINGNATTASITVASAPGEVVIDAISAHDGKITITPGSGQAQRWNSSSGGGKGEIQGAGSTAPGSASVTMSWTLSKKKKFALGAVSIIPVTFQPDAMIKLATEPDAAYLTDGVYESTAATQTRSLAVLSGSTAGYTIRFDNDGGLIDDLAISGTGTGSGFTVQYLDETATDRTAAVTGGGYTITALPPGASRVWTLNVTPSGDPTPVAGGTPYTVLVTAASATVPAIVDQVEAVTTSISANLTLAKSVDKATAIPTEDITYTVMATNGTGLSDATGIIVGDPIPANTGFRLGSASFSPGTTSLTASASYSSDGGTTWTYTPASGMCGAPAGYDDCVTDIRWTMSGTMQADESFSVVFVVRVK